MADKVEQTVATLQQQVNSLQQQLAQLQQVLFGGTNPGSNFNPLGSGGFSNVTTGTIYLGNQANLIVSLNAAVYGFVGLFTIPGVSQFPGAWFADFFAGGGNPNTALMILTAGGQVSFNPSLSGGATAIPTTSADSITIQWGAGTKKIPLI